MCYKKFYYFNSFTYKRNGRAFILYAKNIDI